MNEFNVRSAIKEDGKRVWELRNDPIARHWSRTPAEIPFDQKWFLDKYFGGGKNQCCVLEYRGQVVAYCRIDYQEKEGAFEVSIAVDSTLQGRGLGTKILMESVKLFAHRPLLAHIKKGNAISLRLFEKQGFAITGEGGEFLKLILEK